MYDPYGMPHHGGGGGGYGGGGGGGSAPGAAAADGGTTILKLRGLPYQVQDEDIIRWFDDPAVHITPLTADRCASVTVGMHARGVSGDQRSASLSFHVMSFHVI